MKIAFIGFGNMARAIAQHWIHLPDCALFASAPTLPIGKTPEGIETHYDNLAIAADSSLIILAVKPGITGLWQVSGRNDVVILPVVLL